MSHLHRFFSTLTVLLGLLALCENARAADPTTADCLAANDTSISLRNEHKLRAARAQLLVCAARTCPADVRNECTRRVGEVNAAMPTVVFEAKDFSGKDLAAVKVMMDGEALAERLEGTALSLDPGEHSFVFDAEGQPELTKQLIIHEGEKDRHESFTFGETAASPAATAPRIAEAPPVVAPHTRSKLGTQKSFAIAAAGVGAVGVIVGAVFGVQAMSKKSDAQKACPNNCADQGGVDAWSRAKTAGDVSTVAFIVGGLGLAGGAVLWFTARQEPSDAPRVDLGMGFGSIRLKGAW
jgi:hypothetical protein